MSDKVKNIVVTITFMSIIVIVLLINVLKKDELVSISERRKLATFPEFSIDKLLDRTFIDKFDKYTMDQFLLRDEFRSLKTFFELNVFGKKDVRNVYLYNGTIIKQEYPLNEKSVLNITKRINEIKDKYLDERNNIYYSIIPDKNYHVDNEYLKMNYSKLLKLMNDNLNDIEYIDIFDCIKLEDYYYTDTHWKQENLQKVVEKISKQMKFNDRLNTEFETQEITKFNGVYSGQLQVKTPDDYIKIQTNDIIDNSKVFNFETKEETNVYNLEKVKSADKYDIYLSGATPLLTIENKNASTDKELIVFRDSFGSSLVPLFTEAYSKITLIDTRYISSKLLDQYVNFNNKDVLFIYSTLVINNSSTLK